MNKESTKKTVSGKLIVSLSVVVLFLIIVICFLFIGTDKAFVSKESNVNQVTSERVKLSNTPIKIQEDADGYWNIICDKYVGKVGENQTEAHNSQLKILQLSDLHFGSGILSVKNDIKTIKVIDDLIKWASPDIIIVTGDAIYPVPFTSGTLNNGRGAQNFANLMDKFKIPWAFVFGNHDTEAYGTTNKFKVSNMLKSHKYNGVDKFCLYQEGPTNFKAVKGGEVPLGNYPILVRDTANKLTHVMMFMDSNKYNKASEGPPFFKYDNIHKDQSDWYKETLKDISLKNGYALNSMVTSSLFIHIPIKQYKEAWQKVVDDHIETEADKRKKKLRDQDEVKYFGGDMQEYTRDPKDTTISCSTLDTPIWDAILELKSTKFIFVGHDHDNNFSIEYEGVRLTYTKSIDFQAYPGISKRTFQRGATVILLTGDEGDKALEIYQKKYAMLNDPQISEYNTVKASMEDVYLGTENPKMMHPMKKIKLTISLVVVFIALGVTSYIAVKIIKKKKLNQAKE